MPMKCDIIWLSKKFEYENRIHKHLMIRVCKKYSEDAYLVVKDGIKEVGI